MQPVTDFLGFLGGNLTAGFIQAQVPSISPWEVLFVLLGAGALCLPSAWKYASLLTSVVHELGHAGAAISAGRFVTGIRIHPDHSGETHTFGLAGPPTVWAMFWGYPIPSIAGGVLVWASLAGRGQGALSVCAVVLALSLLAIRNLFGAALVLGCAALSLVLVWINDPQIGAHATLILGTVLLAGSLRSFGEVVAIHTRYPEDLESSDAHILALETGVPAGVWLTLLGTAITASWYGTLAAPVPLLHLAE